MGNQLNSVISKDPFGIYQGPESTAPPSFDPLVGFPNGRKKRVMIATDDEMEAAQVPYHLRDYCAHKYLDVLACKRVHFPLMIKCAHEHHEYAQCQFEDYVLRMKEFERERRLLEKQRQKQAKALEVS